MSLNNTEHREVSDFSRDGSPEYEIVGKDLLESPVALCTCTRSVSAEPRDLVDNAAAGVSTKDVARRLTGAASPAQIMQTEALGK